MRYAGLLAFAALAAVVASCWDTAYHCARDQQCVWKGVAGRCESTGYCSFPSDSCVSHRMYGDHSPLAGSCVPDDGTDLAAPPACGNGVLDPGEACDPAISPPNAGVCPTLADCDDHNPCTVDSLEGSAAQCSARCVHTFITACGPKDQCCPSGCTATTDSDCSATCGNGVVDGSESCDKAIPAGQPGACPTSCPPQNACTTYMLIGAASVCTARCVSQMITTCSGALVKDGCCPPGCSVLNDGDCV